MNTEIKMSIERLEKENKKLKAKIAELTQKIGRLEFDNEALDMVLKEIK